MRLCFNKFSRVVCRHNVSKVDKRCTIKQQMRRTPPEIARHFDAAKRHEFKSHAPCQHCPNPTKESTLLYRKCLIGKRNSKTNHTTQKTCQAKDEMKKRSRMKTNTAKKQKEKKIKKFEITSKYKWIDATQQIKQKMNNKTDAKICRGWIF